ncbi:MAG: TonB-dependent receptor plug domain-containing protein [Alistipes sp.]|nr:TonB-dependent receptor plug domain-containing protein [Alistipes sp.]
MTMKRLLFLVVALCYLMPASAQEFVPFNGLLLDAASNPIKQARVWVKSEERYAKSDKKGRFGLSNVAADDTLKVRWEKRTYYIPVQGKRSMQIRIMEDLDYSAEESMKLLDYGSSYVRQREYIGFNSQITGEELLRTGCTDILSALSGLIPGLNVSENPEDGTYSVNIRNTSGMTGNPTPLYIVDEIEVRSIDHIQLNQVAYVVVMKDAAIYGVRGGNGAIVVRTKSASTFDYDREHNRH